MSFVQGVAQNYADLAGALEAALLANGWSKTGAVLHAGGCHVTLAVVGTTIVLTGGTGVSGTALQEPGPGVRIGTAGVMSITFPATYHIAVHGSPSEVALHVNYDVDKWQWLAFGEGTISVPGSGGWHAGSFAGDRAPTSLWANPVGNLYGGNAGRFTAGLFHGDPGGSYGAGSYIHTGVDGSEWVSASSGHLPSVSSAHISIYNEELLKRTPSALNAAAVLLPAQVWQARAGNTASLVGDFAHFRVLRIDNHVPGEIISYGSDRWRVYPYYRKNAAERDGGNWSSSNFAQAHTGTMGMAVRYDGP